jgi:conserved oligomeric Golgi complex subunit 5
LFKQALRASYLRIAGPLLNAIRLDISAIISRLHRVDWSGDADAMARGMGGPSPYSKELADKLTFIRTEILSKYNVGELGQEW